MITHAFDVAVVNSWLEYRRDKERQGTRPQQIMDLLDFKMNVAEALVRVGKPHALRKRGRPSSSNTPSPCTSPTPHDEPAKKRRAMEQRPIQEVQTDMLDHMPNYDEKKKKQQGANCQAIPEKRMSTVTSARCTSASCHRKTASKMPPENEAKVTEL